MRPLGPISHLHGTSIVVLQVVMQLLNEEKVAQVDATRFPIQPEGIPRDEILSRPLGPTSCDLGPVPPRTETVFGL